MDPTAPSAPDCPICMLPQDPEGTFALTICCRQIICDRCVAGMLLMKAASGGATDIYCPYCRAWMDPDVEMGYTDAMGNPRHPQR